MDRWRRAVRAAAVAAVVGLSGSACLAEPGAGRNRGAEDDVVEVMYGFSGDQSRSFQDIVQPWADQNGIKVRLSSTPDFDKLIRSRVAGNNLPDIAIYPQPGITLDIALSGRLFDLNTVVDTSRYNKNNMYLFDAASDAEGRVWAIPMSTSVKSLVWYPKKAFEAKGYTVPKTHQELLALTDKIKADGTPPWCVGIESQAATGWPATDWVEDYVLRFGGGAKYKQWTSHQIPFNDPLIQQAVDEIGKIWFPEGNVLGDRGSIASTNFATAGNPMFENPPKCFLHRQASFLAQPGNFPDRIVQNIDTEAGVFPLPPVQAGAGQPVLGAGDLAGLFNDNPDTVRVLEFITSKEFGNQLAPDGGFISPWKDFDRSKYPNETMRAIAEIAYSSTEAVFDGSDTMPGEVGSGSFWRGMVTWVTGQEDTATVLRDIDESWPDY
ncbi:ABC transporter substrate-binding protein [Paractinoplanes rishiriensis]|uniref:ABC transporter substrate-binding protein n=1 Tax=Paractinoplanes rishiriensis TaxID=1050105 RepID=UPI001943F425|nr:ABC transporter substrate-binding protein [Actinoplanes rishiriensis]